MSFQEFTPESDAQVSAWIDQLDDACPSFLACNEPNWLSAIIERVTQAFPQYRHILLSLSETMVDDFEASITEKLSQHQSGEVMVHIIYLEHSILHHLAEGTESFKAWTDKDALSFSSIRLYGDEPLLDMLEKEAPSFISAFNPIQRVNSHSHARTPYSTILELGKGFRNGDSEKALDIAEQLALAGAVVHAETWYDRYLEQDGKQKTEALIGKAELQLYRQAMREASQLLDEASNALAEDRSDLSGRIHMGRGRILMQQRDRKAAIRELLLARKQLSSEEQPEDWGKACEYLGLLFEGIGDPQAAIDQFLEAGEHWGKLDEHTLPAAKAYQHAAAILQNQLRFNEALQQFSTALEWANQTEDEFLQASLEDSVEAMTEEAHKAGKKQKKGGKGLFGRLFS